ncbi:MAG: GntR family transcriptional regulator [Planctomycetaceae bacterium]|nr:GntR family transcriptional regulator [Planctomycetaceae bacterium]
MPLTDLSTTISRTSLADEVYETLVEAIVNGQLESGSLLSSVELSRQLQVSRTPVTEALQRLTFDGLVEQVNNRQARVTQLSLEEIEHIYEMRALLEGAAAERAANNLSSEQIALLIKEAKQLKARRKEVNWHEQAIEFDLRFHQILADAAGNKRLRDDILRYRRLVRCFCRMTGNENNLLSALEEHHEILKALQEGKPATARKTMVSHIKQRLAAVRVQFYPD